MRRFLSFILAHRSGVVLVAALAFTVGGETIFRKSVGPAKAQRFLGKAFDANKAAVIRAVDVAAARIVSRVLA